MSQIAALSSPPLKGTQTQASDSSPAQPLSAIRRHILTIAQADPLKASLTSHQVVDYIHTGRDIDNRLRAQGLPLNGLSDHRLLGGGLTDLAAEALKGTIKLLKDGNLATVNASKGDAVIRATIQLPDGTWKEGTHSGGRTLSDPRYACLCLLPTYSLVASGKGEFISDQVTYRGNFHHNQFHDNTGQAEYFIASHLRYKGGFAHGKRSGVGTLERYDPQTQTFSPYYQGTWDNDAPQNGTYTTTGGETIALENGMLGAISPSPSSSSPRLRPQPPSPLRPSDYQLVPLVAPFGPSAPSSTTSSRQPPQSLSPSPSLATPPTTSTPAPPSRPLSPSISLAIPPPSSTPSLQRRPSVSLENNPLVTQKLSSPQIELTLDQSVTLLTDCIQYGLLEAQKAKNQDLLIFIGNTGSGKSTMVNYLAGCTMQRKSPKELGIPGLGKVVVVQPLSQGGALDEIMPIGHLKQSKTFMPQIKLDARQQITYCDCPGFLDNRGAEINIANAVNIRNALLQAKTVRVIILINYHSLKADRGRGLSEMLQISCNLFGHAKNLIHNKDSLLVGITQTPTDMTLTDLKEWISDSHLPAMEALADRVFTFDPLEVPLDGGWDRATVLSHIQALTPITRPGKIFSTVLTDSDETTLIRISEGMRASIQKSLQAGNYKEAAEQLDRLQQLSVVDHITVERLLSQTRTTIDRQFQEWANQFKADCHFEQFAQAQAALRRLEQAVQCFDAELQKTVSIPELQKYYQICHQRMEQVQQKEREYQEQLRQANTRIEEFIALLEEQKRNTQRQLQEQQKNFEAMRLEMQKSIDATTHSYETMKGQLLQEMELRLKQKEEELQTTQTQGSQEVQHRVEQEKSKLRSEYEQKLKEMEDQKREFMERQRVEQEKQERHLQQEKAALEAKLKELDARKVEQVRQIAPLVQKLPDIAFGKALWEKFIGDVGVEPPLPADIEKILSSPCPFSPDKKVRETHMLVLVPETVNGKPLTIKTLGELVQQPRQGNATKYNNLYLGEYKDPPAPKSHWALMTRDVVPDSRNKSYQDQQALIARYSQQTKKPYEVPTILDGAVCMFMEYFCSGKRLYSDSPWTYTRCQEKYDGTWQLAVGGFAPGGLSVGNRHVDHDYDGVGALWKFF